MNITKGASLSLTKAASEAGAKLEKVIAAAGWDTKADLDLVSIYLGEDGKAIPDENGNGSNADEAVTAYFNLNTAGAAHQGDNLTGEGDGDDEQIVITLADVPANVKEIAILIASYSGEKFTDVKGAFVRLVNTDGDAELVKFDLTDKYPDTRGVEMGRLVRTSDGWDFKATGVEIGGEFKAIVESYGVTGLN